MTWNASFPLDNTKLRLAPSGLRGNFNAIQQGNVPMRRVKLAEQASDPTREADRGFIYTKEDASTTTTELWYINDNNPASKVQLTQDGFVGSPTSRFIVQDIFTTTSTIANNQNGFVSAWATVAATGASMPTSYNVLSVVHVNGSGTYTFTLSPTLSTADYAVVVTALATTQTKISIRVRGRTTNQFVVDMMENGVSTDIAFSFSVFGGRVGV
jgi:hypothetical protein